jgi:hypothetical protein
VKLAMRATQPTIAPMKYALPLAFAALIAASVKAQDNTSKIYAVGFDTTLGPDMKVEDLKVSKVIDPSFGSNDAVAVAVPDSFIEAAKAQLR